MFTFMSNRYNTENTDRSEAMRQLIAEQRDAAAALSDKFHVVVTKKRKEKKRKNERKKSIYLPSEYILHFETFLPLGVTESLTEEELISYSYVSKQCTSESTKIMNLASTLLVCSTPPSCRAGVPRTEA